MRAPTTTDIILQEGLHGKFFLLHELSPRFDFEGLFSSESEFHGRFHLETCVLSVAVMIKWLLFSSKIKKWPFQTLRHIERSRWKDPRRTNAPDCVSSLGRCPGFGLQQVYNSLYVSGNQVDESPPPCSQRFFCFIEKFKMFGFTFGNLEHKSFVFLHF